MGAVSFSLDPRLVAAVQIALPLNVLVETGTFKGDTVAESLCHFDKIISSELSPELWAEAAKRFEEHSHVRILQGNSPDKLREVLTELQDEGVLYWLDAHWCVAAGTAGELSQCPLLAELQAIGKLNEKSVVLIDDARLFLAPPLAPHEISHWPSFHQIVASLLSMSTEHELMVVNDVIAFYPKRAEAAMVSYAQSYGTDWLNAANCWKQSGTFMQQLAEKESELRGLAEKESELRRKEEDIQRFVMLLKEKEAVITQQNQALRAYQLAFNLLPFLRPAGRAIRRIISVFWPRLGNLNQYAPRPLVTALLSANVKQLTATPKFSVVTPSYQQGCYIERTIQSVLNQSYPNLEYYVQDGGSKDSTADVLKKYQGSLSGWVSEKDSGQSQAINLGFAETNGEIMAWLNSDDLLLPGALHTVADYFSRHPNVDVVYGNRLLIDENDMEIGRWILPGHDSAVLSWADYVPQETLFWRRSIWDKVGGQIDESFRFAMDWDLLVRFRDVGAKFSHIPQFLGAFRIHEHQKTSAVINEIGHQEMDRIRARLLGHIPTQMEVRKAVTPFLLRHIFVDLKYRVSVRLRGGR